MQTKKSSKNSSIHLSTFGQSLWLPEFTRNQLDLRLNAHKVHYHAELGLKHEVEDLLWPAERLPNLGLYPVIKYWANEKGMEVTGSLTARPASRVGSDRAIGLERRMILGRLTFG